MKNQFGFGISVNSTETGFFIAGHVSSADRMSLKINVLDSSKVTFKFGSIFF